MMRENKEKRRFSGQRRKNMDTKKLIPIISVVSVAVMMLWGTLGNAWDKSWLAVFIGGIAITVISIMNKDKKE